uniref:Uncharacterized protein n=1 Tax=Glossina palpalis gambiensis TaxID=67801 RepID=A0A1B0AW92_9MUSC
FNISQITIHLLAEKISDKQFSQGEDRQIKNKFSQHREDNFLHFHIEPPRGLSLGKHFRLPEPSAEGKPITLDVTGSYTPIYSHLKIHDIVKIERPSTPPIIRRIENENYMDFYEASPTKSDAVENMYLRLPTIKPVYRSSTKAKDALFSNYFPKKRQ